MLRSNSTPTGAFKLYVASLEGPWQRGTWIPCHFMYERARIAFVLRQNAQVQVKEDSNAKGIVPGNLKIHLLF